MHATTRDAIWPSLALALSVALLCGPLSAQAQEPTVPADPPPAGSPQVVPEKIEPQRPIGPPPQTDSLSEDLSETNGVIQPPKGIDPGLVEPPPDDGAAVGPVVKPPPPPQ